MFKQAPALGAEKWQQGRAGRAGSAGEGRGRLRGRALAGEGRRRLRGRGGLGVRLRRGGVGSCRAAWAGVRGQQTPSACRRGPRVGRQHGPAARWKMAWSGAKSEAQTPWGAYVMPGVQAGTRGRWFCTKGTCVKEKRKSRRQGQGRTIRSSEYGRPVISPSPSGRRGSRWSGQREAGEGGFGVSQHRGRANLGSVQFNVDTFNLFGDTCRFTRTWKKSYRAALHKCPQQ